MHHWSHFAELYEWEFDLVCTRQKHDVGMWKKLAGEYGGPILELGCGGGRITIPLLEGGHTVTALDYAPGMIELLKRKAGNHPKLTTICASMAEFALDETFAFAFIPYSSFQLLQSLEEQMLCLRNARRHLKSGSILALDLDPAVIDDRQAPDMEHSYTAPWESRNAIVACYTSWEDDRVFKSRTWHDRYDIFHHDGSFESQEMTIAMRDLDLDYMNLLLMNCGFHIEDVFGSFDGGPFTSVSHNMIILAKKYD